MNPTSIHFGYSAKNIPLQSKAEYLKSFVINQEAFGRRFRWKALSCLDKNFKKKDLKTYGFKTPATPSLPIHPLRAKLVAFEKDFFSIPRRIKFRNYSNKFQDILKKDLKEKVKQNKNIIVPSDKTKNFYSLPKKDYEDLKRGAVCAEYSRCCKSEIEKVNKEAAALVDKRQLADRVECFSDQ